jgi:hypothetical protein
MPMPFSPRSPGGAVTGKVYLFNCPFEEKEDAKKAGAKWDFMAGSWYVPGGQSLEPFNKWHPNERKYLLCDYNDKDDAKKAGARWDASCKQWYFDANDIKAESKLAKWLPSTKNTAAPKPKKKKKMLSDTTNKIKVSSPKKAKPRSLTKSQLATIPRINNDMTITHLLTECRARDPSIRGLSTKNKTWLLEHLQIGTPWISAATASTNEEPKKTSEDPPPAKKPPANATASTKKAKHPIIHVDMTVAQLQLECRARDPDIKGLSTKNKSWFLNHLKIGTKWKSVDASTNEEPKKSEDPHPIKKQTTATKKTPSVAKAFAKESPTIHADMTIAQLEMECRARDPDITGLSNKNKSWLLEHLKIGTPRAPAIHADMTIAQLQMECRARNPDITGLSNKNKSWLLEHLKIGTPRAPSIHADMTITQLQIECRVRDPTIKGLTNKNKSWFLDHLKIGTAWMSRQEGKILSASNLTAHAAATSKPKSETVAKRKGANTTTTKTKNIKTEDATPTQKPVPVARKTQLNYETMKPTLMARQYTESRKYRQSLLLTKNSTPDAKSNSSKETKRNTKKSKIEPSSIVQVQVLKLANAKTSRVIKHDPDVNYASETRSEPSAKKQKITTATNPSQAENWTAETSTQTENRTAANSEIATASISTQTVNLTASLANASTSGATTTNRPSTSSVVTHHARVTNKMTLAVLREEAKSRLMYEVPRLKSDLLNHLVEGSICVHESPEYAAYHNLLSRIKNEAPALRRAAAEKNREIEARREKLRMERQAKEEKKQAEEERKIEEERQDEISRQKALHVHSFPRAHTCLLAKTGDLTMCEDPRSQHRSCNFCRNKHRFYCHGNTPDYSCESCDWDICETCLNEENKTKAEKEEFRKKREQEWAEERRKENEEEEKEEEAHRQRWDATLRFTPEIRKVKGKHLDPDSSEMKFTVWCSDSYGFHRCNEESPKEFDSAWTTKEEANCRAEYLFYWKNAWGHRPESLNDNNEVESKNTGDLKGWAIRPDGGSQWTVCVVPSDAFRYLSNVCKERHNLDDESGEESGEERSEETSWAHGSYFGSYF